MIIFPISLWSFCTAPSQSLDCQLEEQVLFLGCSMLELMLLSISNLLYILNALSHEADHSHATPLWVKARIYSISSA